MSFQSSAFNEVNDWLPNILKSNLFFAVCEEPKPKVATLVSNPIQCLNRELKSSNALRGDFWVFYNYIPAKGKYTPNERDNKIKQLQISSNFIIST